jgi:hypothetical protein
LQLSIFKKFRCLTDKTSALLSISRRLASEQTVRRSSTPHAPHYRHANAALSLVNMASRREPSPAAASARAYEALASVDVWIDAFAIAATSRKQSKAKQNKSYHEIRNPNFRTTA